MSLDQKKVITELQKWWENKPDDYITLGGFAGTGKTTLIGYFRQFVNSHNKKTKVAFASYTGKATRVLEEKLKSTKAVYPKDYVGTIHSLIYSPVTNSKGEITGWERKDDISADLLIIDEASMVDEKIWKDLLRYNIPIFAVGDHGQLPPIHGKFNLMDNPRLKLEKIHRQAEGNPIIQLSIQARNFGQIDYGRFNSKVMKLKKAESDTREIIGNVLLGFDEDTLVLCGYNNTRIKLNDYVRKSLEIFNPEPQLRDRVICLRNNHKKQIFNGMIGSINSIEEDNEDFYFAKITMDGKDDEFRGIISKKQFNNPTALNFTKDRRKTISADLFDFGYAITVHKAQGSQSRRVVLFEERFKQMDDDMWRRWLYTAITRAEEELYIVA